MGDNSKPDEKGLNIIMIYADMQNEWNCSQWRNLTPADAINRSNPHTVKLIHISGFMDYLSPSIQELISPADIIIVQRNVVSDEVLSVIQYWQGMGKPVAVDLDDAYHILPRSNPAHRYWIDKNDSLTVDILESGLQICDGLIAPNRLLLSDWSHVTNGYFLANYSERKWWENLKSRSEMKAEKKIDNDRIVIGWGGSVSHYDSFFGSGIFDAAKAISIEYPQVLWMICGNDERIYNYLPVPDRQKIHQEGVPPEQWPQIVKTFDIGVAPIYGAYDQRRSWIKGLEYLHAGVPWVGVVGEPYRDLAQFGTLIQNGASNWEKAITYMIDNLDEQQAIADARIEMSKQWYADNRVDVYVKVFKSIIKKTRNDKGMLPGVYYVKPD